VVTTALAEPEPGAEEKPKFPGGEWGDFEISPPAVKKHYRNSSFGQQSGYFICSKFAANKSCHVTSHTAATFLQRPLWNSAATRNAL
jgi:hypothetical protein